MKIMKRLAINILNLILVIIFIATAIYFLNAENMGFVNSDITVPGGKVAIGSYTIEVNTEDNDGLDISGTVHARPLPGGVSGNLCLHEGTVPAVSTSGVGHRIWVDSLNKLWHQDADGVSHHIIVDDGAGNVGIGTPSPSEKLDVQGPSTGDIAANEYDAFFGAAASNAGGAIKVGGFGMGSGGGMASVGTPGINLNGTVVLRNLNTPGSRAEFALYGSDNDIRFAIPINSAGLGTYNARSMILAGPAVFDDDIFLGSYWGFDLAMDTGTYGADLGVQNDIQALGDIYTKSWTDYGSSSTVVGFSGTPTVNIWYKKVGNLVYINWNIWGTSNANNFTFTLPYTSMNSTGFIVTAVARTVDAGVVNTGSGYSNLNNNSATVSVYYDWAGTNTWTASGAKQARGQFWFEAQ